MIVAAVAATQLAHGSYRNDLATHPDEAAHFVTAMCLLDYARTALGSNPVLYAESYYVHYPKVAFGHWPPAFFGMQALWYWVFGGSVQAGMLLIGAIAAAAGVVLFTRLRRFHGTMVAVLAVSVYLSLPLVWQSSATLMSDMLASLCEILAVLSFCDGCVERTWKPWAASALWAGAAILTKESALSLLVCAPIAFMTLAGGRLGGRAMRRYFWPAFFLLALPLLAIYGVSGVRHVRGLLPQHITPAAIGERAGWLFLLPQLVSWPVIIVAAGGALFAFDAHRPIHIRGAALWLMVCVTVQIVIRNGTEPRYLLPAVFALVILFGEGLAGITDRAAAWLKPLTGPRSWSSAVFARVLPVTIAMASIATLPSAVFRHRDGYQRVVDSIPSKASETVLVSSDPAGEGAMIVDFLLDARPVIVLRSSKMLASSDWVGSSYRLLLTTPAEVANLLDTMPVHFIVLDANGFFDAGSRPNHRLLEQTLTAEPNHFQLIADIPLGTDRGQSQHMIQVYENRHAEGRAPERIRIPMELSLRRTIEVNVRDENRVGIRSAPTSRFGVELASALRRLAATVRLARPSQDHQTSGFLIRPGGETVGPEGGPGEFSVQTDTQQWEVLSTAPWISISSTPQGSRDAVLRYDVAQNDSDQSRSGTIVVGDARYTVVQTAGR